MARAAPGAVEEMKASLGNVMCRGGFERILWYRGILYMALLMCWMRFWQKKPHVPAEVPEAAGFLATIKGIAKTICSIWHQLFRQEQGQGFMSRTTGQRQAGLRRLETFLGWKALKCRL